MKIYRCYSEKREGFDLHAGSMLRELRDTLGIKSLQWLRIFCRYDVEGIDDETWRKASVAVFSEPPCDLFYEEELPAMEQCRVLSIEALPGQFDQRADSCEQCIQLITCGERPRVACATVYALGGDISDEDYAAIAAYLINPVETREASNEKPESLAVQYEVPADVAVVEGFVDGDDAYDAALMERFSLAMDAADIQCLRDYFKTEGRNPTVTELKVVDTYWSDHCRHTTFSTQLDVEAIEEEHVQAAFDEYLAARREIYGDKAETRPITLMDIATCGMKLLKKRGILTRLDESEEINACSVKVDIEVDGKEEQWLLMFKNETHNHPTEIEPFGGAATCIGGAIRDPLSGRAYVYQAMRVTGAADPRAKLEDTLANKLPQRKIVTKAAEGYSSYGNQIGLATGYVQEYYHPKYVAKRMEVGAVVGAAPADSVVREVPAPGDMIILLGGRTGRDGIGGATGSSKTHTSESLTQCSAEVQKGNAPEERKIQRLFRNAEIARIIKRCNDFGAGGVSVAIGELADGVRINLDEVRKKYEGLDGTEIAISESQERMAVVVAKENVERFIKAANEENLEATVVAEVTAEPRMVMLWRGKAIANIARSFLDTNGARKYAKVKATAGESEPANVAQDLETLVTDLSCCSQEGLVQRFDGSIGAGSVLMPFGGKYQKSPEAVMAALLPTLGKTDDCSVMACGFDPWLSDADPFRGAQAAVTDSVAKLIAAGCSRDEIYLSFQEYFEKLGTSAERWGKPLRALLGGFTAQVGLDVAAIGGKDSMSGSFLDKDVPPTLISFAIAHSKADKVLSCAFKGEGHPVYLFRAGAIGDFDAAKNCWNAFLDQHEKGNVLAARSLDSNGAAKAVFYMALGNAVGFKSCTDMDFYAPRHGDIIAECACEVEGAQLIGHTTCDGKIVLEKEYCLKSLQEKWEKVLEGVFPMNAPAQGKAEPISVSGVKLLRKGPAIAKPRAVIPVFPGTNCEYDTARAVERAGGVAKIVVLNTLSAQSLEESAQTLTKEILASQMLILPGGFSGGDEPDGSGKFIASFLRNASITDAVHTLLKEHDGLALGICNGFQALIKLGLVPWGEIKDMTDESPTLTFNNIGRHQSRYVRTRVCTTASPWLSKCEEGAVYSIPISHGEGRFTAPAHVLEKLIANGQVATQYVDENGAPMMDISANPNGSVCAIEGILSPDGRVLGKMGHTERNGKFIGKNIEGNKFQPIFEGGVAYYL
ncbi:MAG: phosphoribosylformylglycinamidine synthase [Oscillospiraceae bacterium]|nr:phosphoribosylformylglycinamidine synthase [Oscillospiraceae bacterium]